MPDDLSARQAAQGEKMIEVRIRFWTNELAETKGDIKPKHAWGSGVVMMDRNRSHGISPQNPIPFQSLLDLPQKIEKVLIDHGVTIHKSSRMKKYMP
jgi:hypothetical protein